MTDDSDSTQKRKVFTESRVFIGPKVTASAAEGREERGQVYIAPKVVTTPPKVVTDGDQGQGTTKKE